MTIDITHNEGAHRYELRLDGDLASIAEYTPSDGHWIFDHTETEPRFRGQGLAAKVVAYALDDVRKRGLRVTPSCAFVADFVRPRPEYGELVA